MHDTAHHSLLTRRRSAWRAAGATIFILLAFIGLFSACGAVGDTCLFDSDCSGGNLCVREICLATCSVDSDCSPPYGECLAFNRESKESSELIKICADEQFAASVRDIDDTQCREEVDCCTSHRQCAELFEDESARCGADERCFIPREE